MPAIRFLGGEDDPNGEARIHVETIADRAGCPSCGVVAKVKDRPVVVLVDLPVFGRCSRLVWHKRRWWCPDEDCATGTFTEMDERIATQRQVLTSRAARWATEQVGGQARSVNEVARELGCDWHTVNDTVVAYGEALLEEDTDRIGQVTALGLDEVLMVRRGPFHRQEFSTQMVDVRRWQLLDVVTGRSSAGPMAWLAEQGPEFRDWIEYGTLDLSGPYRRVFELMTPRATLVADPFHVCKLANTKLDECRRRVQNETLGHRGRKADPLYRCRRLLTMAKERLDDKGAEKLRGLLRAGDPTGDVSTLWEAKEAVRELYAHADAELALEWATELGRDLQDPDYPPEARSLGRTLIRWRHQIAAWHEAHVTNGPTEAVNNLIKRVKRAAFGF
ncbi:MAG: ISL3 family transposase, partial [Acidimicrobiales bacterium]